MHFGILSMYKEDEHYIFPHFHIADSYSSHGNELYFVNVIWSSLQHTFQLEELFTRTNI